MTPDTFARLHAAAFTNPRPWSAAEFAVLLAQSTTIAVAAEQGFALGRLIGEEAELLTIAVAPAARRLGVGRGLLRRFVTAVAARGGRTIFLEVSSLNDSAIALYLGEEFHKITLRKDYYSHAGQRADALIMRRNVTANGT